MSWWPSTRRDADFRREIDAHLELETASQLANGLPPRDARAAARRSFGNVTRAQERFYEARRIMWLDDLVRDLRHGLRMLRRAPGFSAVAVLTLALGIGATTAVYSIVDTILLQPLPYADADHLVRVIENVASSVPGRAPLVDGVGFQALSEWRAHSKALTDIAGITYVRTTVRTGSGAAQLNVGMTSENVFTLLGVSALLGRTLNASDAQTQDAAVLSFDTWQRFFGSDRKVVGATMEVRLPARPDGRLLTIVGVMPADFVFPTGQPLDFYMPMSRDEVYRRYSFDLIGRLDARSSLKAATDEANVIGSAIPRRNPKAPPLTIDRFEARSLKEQNVRGFRPYLQLLLAAVGVVLLIVCANVANLLLARGTARRREMAARFAIGACRGRVIRQVLTESLVLAIAGGALGVLIASSTVGLVKSLASVDAPGVFRYAFNVSVLPRVNEIRFSVKMFGVALGIAAATSVLFGVLPALRLSSMRTALNVRTGASRPGDARLRSTLVVAQLVLATVLLVGAGLLTHSFVKLSTVEKGYDPANVLAFQLVFPVEYTIPRKTDVIGNLLDRLRAIPGVESAGFTRAGVLIPEELHVGTFVPPGSTTAEMRNDSMHPALRSVSPGYLTAIGVRVLEGRELEATTRDTSTPGVVITRSVARRYFGAARAVGQTLDWHVSDAFTTVAPVVGVVEDLRNESPDKEPRPEIFADYRQLLRILQQSGDPISRQDTTAIGFLSFAVRTKGDPRAIAPAVSQAIRSVDPNAGIESILPLDRLFASSVAPQRFAMVMLSIFAGVAGFLAAIGVYGVLAYHVTQRTHEIGVRMALGAQTFQVLGLVLRQGTVLTIAGVTLGIVAAAAATRILQSLLFGITPLDLPTFVGVSMLFGTVAMLASYLPARRATLVDPLAALRCE